jgi:histidyl-tRNA synthetase
VAQQKVTLKDMRGGEQCTVPIGEAIERLTVASSF